MSRPAPLYRHEDQHDPNLNPQFKRIWDGRRFVLRLVKDEGYRENARQRRLRKRREARAIADGKRKVA